MVRLTRLAQLALVQLCSIAALAQSPKITKVDPPNWWANMPKPMLLVRGENLTSANFHLSDPRLHIEQSKISANGHWVELWLAASPSAPETVTITATTPSGKTTLPYQFAPRHKPTEGFAGFSSRDVMYLIMIDRFADGDLTNDGSDAHDPADSPAAQTERAKPRGWHGGDLRGITQHLDYLQQLGITTIWITPVYQNHEPDSYHGYGATDMYAVDDHYGKLNDLKALSAALHARGMKLVLDTVPNHVGPAHPWVEDEPEPDWFHGTKSNHRAAQGDFKPLVDPHAPWRNQRDVTEGWFANTLPDMNQENPAAAQYLIQNAIWWTEQASLDGLRLDTFPYIGRPFWKQFHAQLHSLYPRLTTVGEIFNPDATIVSAFAGGVTRTSPLDGVDTGLDTPFDFPSYFALRDVFVKGAPLSHLADTLRLDALYPHPERLTPFLGNHDTTRFLWEQGASTDTLKLAFAVLFTMRGMPQIYSGDEIAMTGGEDPDNRRDFPGGFPDATQNAFTASTRAPEQQQMHDWVSTLLKLRERNSELQSGEQQFLLADTDQLLYVRGIHLSKSCEAAPRIVIAVNRSDEPHTNALPTQNTALEGCDQMKMLQGDTRPDLNGSNLQISLPGKSVLIFELH
jgi:glycosidase